MDRELAGEAPDNESMPDWAELDSPMPTSNFGHLTDLSGGWLPKTDWSRDGIIANDD